MESPVGDEHASFGTTMAAAAASAMTFPLFPSLPPELRAQIWRASLPGSVGPALYIYRKGIWGLRYAMNGEEGYHDDDEPGEQNIYLEFRLDLLDDVRFEVPLLSVNREAREFGLAWVRDQGAEIRPRKDVSYPSVVRPFNLDRDALYVPLNQAGAFLNEAPELESSPDLMYRSYDVRCHLRRLAIPEALFRGPDDFALLSKLFFDFPNIKELIVISDPQPVVPSPDSDDATAWQRWWEFELSTDGALYWDMDSGGLHFNHESPASKALYDLASPTVDLLGPDLIYDGATTFDVRSASIIAG